MVKFHKGMRVRNKDGRPFSNGMYIVTLDREKLYSPFCPWPHWWIKETKTHTSEEDIIPATPPKAEDYL